MRALYAGFDAVGLQYGPGYRTLARAWSGGTSEADGRLRVRAAREGTHAHPADLDDALCTGSLLAAGGGGETRLPFAVEDALLREAAGEPLAVRRSCGRSSRTPINTCSQASRG